MTFDIEDWFQVENFKPYIPFSSWPSCELRVEKNTHKLLDLLDQVSNQPFESPFDRLTVLSDTEGLKALSKVEGQSAVSEERTTDN